MSGARGTVRLIVVVLIACRHTDTPATAPIGANGPYQLEFPRPLTFNSGDDRNPSVTGSTMVYSRLVRDRADRDRCLAFMPVEGGTLERVSCAGGDLSDDTTDAWLEPAISPGGEAIAYVRQRSLRGAFRPAERALVVGLIDAPEAAVAVLGDPYDLTDGREGTGLRAVSWPSDGTLRFLAGAESFDVLTQDTVFESYGVAELDIGTGVVRMVAGTAGALSYTTGPQGEIWITLPGDSVVWSVASDGTASPVAAFPHQLAGVARAGETCVAIVEFPSIMFGRVPIVMAVGPADSAAYGLWNGFIPRRIVSVAGSARVVAEIHRGDNINVFGDGSNLWLLEAR